MMTLLLIIALLAINAFFVAAEFALVKARTARIDGLVKNGGFGAALTRRIQANIEPYLAACQLGITMASLGLGWVGEPFVASLIEPHLAKLGMSDNAIHTTAFIIGFLVFSSLHITVGEQVPKTLAIRKPEPVSLWAAYPLHVFFIVFYPLTWVLNYISKGILTLIGVKEAPHHELYTSDEVHDILVQSTDHGMINKDKGDMISNLFKFDTIKVSRVMMPFHQIKLLDLAKSDAQNREVVKNSNHSRFPLIDSSKNGELVGVVLSKDLHNAVLDGDTDVFSNLRKLSREPLVVSEHQNTARLFEQMREQHSHFAFVIDEYGQLAGIITIEDLLEEIVGDINDETDVADHEPTIQEKSPGAWEADGLLSLSDLEKYTGFHAPTTTDANTLSGLLISKLERMPKVNDAVVFGGFRFIIRAIKARRVGTVDIVYLTQVVDEEEETLEKFD